MSFRLKRHLIIGHICLGLLVALALFARVPSAGAAPLLQDPTPEANAQDCTGCHQGLRGYWEESAHGHALTDPVFQAAWQEQGNPRECLECHTTGYDAETGTYREGGVACLACHSPVPSNHPDSYMPTDVSSRLCGTCHVETFNEWEVSDHGIQGMTCNQCHNPHTAAIRSGHSQELCQSCHNTQGHYYSFTGHAREGLLCTDCHLRINDSPEAGVEGHGKQHHTFKVDLHTCNSCHLQDMHAEVDPTAMGVSTNAKADVACYPAEMVQPVAMTTPTSTATVSEIPHGPSPLVYVLPAAFGILFGAVMAPWVEHRVKGRQHREDQ
ncbi:MAG: cytochrome c3 family protein [Chloroflexota bacterium]|jgi:hypothetical protein